MKLGAKQNAMSEFQISHIFIPPQNEKDLQ